MQLCPTWPPILPNPASTPAGSLWLVLAVATNTQQREPSQASLQGEGRGPTVIAENFRLLSTTPARVSCAAVPLAKAVQGDSDRFSSEGDSYKEHHTEG